METLSRRGRALVDAAKETPRDEDRDRVRAALDVHLIGAASITTKAATAKAAVKAGSVAKVVLTLSTGAKLAAAAIVVSLSAGYAIGDATSPKDPSPPRATVVAIAPATASPSPVQRPRQEALAHAAPTVIASNGDKTASRAPEVQAFKPATAATASTEPPPVATETTAIADDLTPKTPSASDLSEESAAVREVYALLKSGNSKDAFAKLEALDERFPKGSFTDERRAAHISALCAAGRLGEAHNEAESFVKTYPGSIQTARVRASCAFSKAGDGN